MGRQYFSKSSKSVRSDGTQISANGGGSGASDYMEDLVNFPYWQFQKSYIINIFIYVEIILKPRTNGFSIASVAMKSPKAAG